MNDSDNLREQMWDLVYGLLEAQESQALIARIKSDPQAARLYSEVRLQADLVGYAAQVDDSSVVLQAEGAVREGASNPAKKTAAAATVTPAPQARTAGARKRSHTGTWLAGLLASALALLIAVGLYWPGVDQHQLASSLVVADIETARAMPAGISNEVSFHFTGLDGVGRPAVADLAVVDAAGKEIYRNEVVSNGIGQAQVELPGAVLQPGARLKLYSAAKVDSARDAPAEGDATNDVAAASRSPAAPEAREEDKAAILEAELPVQPEPTFAYLLFDRPTIEPGAPIQFSLWNLSAVTGQPVATRISGMAVENADGVVVAEPLWQADADLPVVTGQLHLPADAGMRDLALSLHPLGGQELNVPLQKYQFYFDQAEQRKAGAATLALADTVKRELNERMGRGMLGGKLAEQASKDAVQETPFEQPPAGLSPGAGENKQLDDRAALEGETSSSQGTPASGLAVDDFSSVAAEGRGAADHTLAVPVPPELAGRRALGIVRYRGAAVAKETVEPAWSEADKNSAKDSREPAVARFALPVEVDGPVDVQWFDATSHPPQRVAEQLVARPSQRKLSVVLAHQPHAFRPGEKVQLTLKVTDESGQPAADAMLVARLWSDEAIAASGREPAQLAAIFEPSPDYLAAQEAKKSLASVLSRDRQNGQLGADFREASPAPRFQEAQRPAPADEDALRRRVAADTDGGAMFGGAGVSSGGFGMQPSGTPANDAYGYLPGTAESVASELATFERQTLATNRPHVEAEFSALKLQAEEQRRAAMQTIGRVLLVGGGFGLLLLGLLLLFRLPARRRAVVPAFAVAFASLLIGVAWTGWMSTQRLQELAYTAAPADQQVALAPDAPAPKAAAREYEIEALQEMPAPGGIGGAGALPAEAATPLSAPEGAAVESFAGQAAPADAPAPTTAAAPAEPAPAAPAAPLAADASPAAEESLEDAQGSGKSSERMKGLEKAQLDKSVHMSRAADAEAKSRGPAGRPAKSAGNAVAAGDKPKVSDEAAPFPPEPENLEALPRSASPPKLAAANAPAPPAPAATPEPTPAAPSSPAPATEPPAAAAASTAPSPPGTPALSRSDPAAMKAKSDDRSAALKLAQGGAPGAAGEGVRDMIRQESADTKREKFESGERASSGVPASLYFNPHLTTDARGLATIEFTMPAVESDYRLLIDAVGNGRVGSSQLPIVGRNEP